MKQVIAIHGGDAFATTREYITHRLKSGIDFRWGKNWKHRLGAALGKEYEVILPRMPNPGNARYKAWKERFERLIPYIKDEVILVGHSMGGIFLAKYLSEESFPRKIRATFLVAAPYDKDGERSIVQFTLSNSLDLFRKQGGTIFLYHSKDDPVVAFSELEKHQKGLPDAVVRVFDDRQHFSQEEFREIVEDIQNLG